MGDHSNQPVLQQGIVDQLPGMFIGNLKRKAHTREKDKIIEWQNR